MASGGAVTSARRLNSLDGPPGVSHTCAGTPPSPRPCRTGRLPLALPPSLAPGAPAADAADNLDFHTGTLAGWEGDGFVLAPAGRHGPSAGFAVCSSDRGPKGRKATLHRAI